jgi:hypothetical protein
MAVNDVAFSQHAAIEILMKENNSAANTNDHLHYVYKDSCMDASSVLH